LLSGAGGVEMAGIALLVHAMPRLLVQGIDRTGTGVIPGRACRTLESRRRSNDGPAACKGMAESNRCA
jgi:hypothetical protein